MLYELRQYLVDRGRTIHNHRRMHDHLPPLLARHGVTVAGRWDALAGPRYPMFCYIMEWTDHAERDAAWGSFYADPEWARIRSETNDGFEMIQENRLQFLKPNAALCPDGPSFTGPESLHQLVVHKTAIGRTGEVNAFLADTWLPHVQAAGAGVMGVCDLLSGPDMPAVVMFLNWENEAAWRRGWRDFTLGAPMVTAYDAQRAELGMTLLDRGEVVLMEPLPGLPPQAKLRTAPA
ncbi:hypothetical protein GLS40_09210 [Pseudooceanicola sp. 216_PA32_1]|jgi:hypothetical protein|uniref:NIPSNAP domain-containing protein n=1 Tax=Pseudooceanicola pacificus TaxID=2676438 RepID=A0A844W5V1_9RHOB|nr:NIPSNAP family protein [Pseudooceanicola pacificus]MWB78201.1 hypothetical protein [Pseudooceanicola pacificus]